MMKIYRFDPDDRPRLLTVGPISIGHMPAADSDRPEPLCAGLDRWTGVDAILSDPPTRRARRSTPVPE